MATSIVAAAIPARSAARVDPVQALQKGKYQVLSAGENRLRAGRLGVGPRRAVDRLPDRSARLAAGASTSGYVLGDRRRAAPRPAAVARARAKRSGRL